jgi:hypothetical protein
MGVGGMIVALCGSCTGLFLGGAAWSMLRGADEEGLGVVVIITAVVIGGIPTLIGALLFRWGFSLYRKTGRRQPRIPPKSFD